MGVRLFNRSTRRVALTEAGRVLFDEVAPAVGTIGRAVEQTRRSRSRPAGTIRVHAFTNAVDLFVKPMLPKFLEDYPDVTVDLTINDAVVDIIGNGFDVGLRIGEVIEKDMVAVKLGDSLRQIVVASPAYLKNAPAPRSPHELHQHRCICWRWPHEPRPYQWEFYENGEWFAIAVTGPLIVDNKRFQIEAALASVGLAFVVESSVQHHLDAGRLVPLLTEWSAPFPGWVACYPERRRMAPAVRAFIDSLKRSR